jgi:hypothetical protein
MRHLAGRLSGFSNFAPPHDFTARLLAVAVDFANQCFCCAAAVGMRTAPQCFIV